MRRGVALLVLALLGASVLSAEDLSRRQRAYLAEQGREHFNQKNYELAVESLEKALLPGARKKRLNRWLPLLGRSYELLGNYQKALAVYQRAHKLRRRSVDRALDLARVYTQVDLDDAAIDLYEKALKKHKKRRDIVLALANLHYRSRRLDQATGYVSRYLDWEPRDLAAQKLLARIEEAGGELASAAHRWEGILVQQATAEEYYHLGRLWARQDQFDLANAAYEKAEARGMGSAVFWVDRGILLWTQNQTEKAVDYWSRASQMEGGPMLPRFLLALADYEQNRVAEARVRLEGLHLNGGEENIKPLLDDFKEAVRRRSAGKKGGR